MIEEHRLHGKSNDNCATSRNTTVSNKTFTQKSLHIQTWVLSFDQTSNQINYAIMEKN